MVLAGLVAADHQDERQVPGTRKRSRASARSCSVGSSRLRGQRHGADLRTGRADRPEHPAPALVLGRRGVGDRGDAVEVADGGEVAEEHGREPLGRRLCGGQRHAVEPDHAGAVARVPREREQPVRPAVLGRELGHEHGRPPRHDDVGRVGVRAGRAGRGPARRGSGRAGRGSRRSRPAARHGVVRRPPADRLAGDALDPRRQVGGDRVVDVHDDLVGQDARPRPPSTRECGVAVARRAATGRRGRPARTRAPSAPRSRSTGRTRPTAHASASHTCARSVRSTTCVAASTSSRVLPAGAGAGRPRARATSASRCDQTGTEPAGTAGRRRARS